jgi:hypothetical protein
MQTKLFDIVPPGGSILVRQMKAALVGGLLLIAALCVPAHANTYWSGTLFSGEGLELIYTGAVPTEISASMSPSGGSLPSNCNAAFDQGCNNVALYQYQATVGFGGGAQFFQPLIVTSFYCDDADSCIPLASPLLNSPSSLGGLISPIFSVNALITSGGCMVTGNGSPNVGFPQPSCDGFSPPTSISVSIEIDGAGNLTETPVPAALPLFAAGLGALALLGWRRVLAAKARRNDAPKNLEENACLGLASAMLGAERHALGMTSGGGNSTRPVRGRHQCIGSG